MTKKQKRNLKKIIISFICFIVLAILDHLLPNKIEGLLPFKYGWILSFVLYFSLYIYIARDVLIKCFKNLKNGHVFDENFLMSVATIGAFGLGIYNAIRGVEIEGFDEGVAVIIFYQVGEWFQKYAVGKSRKSITALMDIRPDFANVIRDDEVLTVSPDDVKIDEIILVKPGEKVPLDGIVIEGSSSLDTKSLTGESLPRDINVGETIISGSVNLTTQIKIKVTKVFYDSTVSKILDLVENASNKKSKTEEFITKFAKWYTPFVCYSALALIIIPSVIGGHFDIWLYRGLSFLVVSCPCALVISIPLSFVAGIGAASKYGILVKGSNFVEAFNRSNIFVFDKTGTITKGNFAITSIEPKEAKDEILKYAAIAENNSSHPIARSIVSAYGLDVNSDYVLTNVAGRGIIASGEHTILCGNAKLLYENNISFVETDKIGTVVYVAKDNEFLGTIVIADEIKEEAKETIKELNKMGAKTVMLTGDSMHIAESVAKEVGFSEVRSELLPQNKVEEVEKLLASKKERDILCFVGDGINDAPVLTRSDIGIAMGGVGSDAAIEASDIVLMNDDLRGLSLAKKIARKTMFICNENIYFALGIKLLVLIFSALGITGMWVAVFGDVGVSILAILNAMRCNSKYN